MFLILGKYLEDYLAYHIRWMVEIYYCNETGVDGGSTCMHYSSQLSRSSTYIKMPKRNC